MAVSDLIHSIRNSRDRIFGKWKPGLQGIKALSRHSNDKEFFDRVFHGLITVMELPENELNLPDFLSKQGGIPGEGLVKNLCIRMDDGVTPGYCIGSCKMLVGCIAEEIAAAEAGEEEKSEAARKLRSAADLLETALVSGWAGTAETGRGGGLLGESSDRAASEKIFSAVFESVGEGILLIDKDMEIVKANRRACEIYGLMVQNLIGAKISSLTDEAGAHILTKFFSELIEGRRMSAEVTCVYVDGKTFPATLTVTRSDMDGGKYWQIIVRDDTDRKNMEKQLREEKQIVEEMNLTLKNVLNSIEREKKELENRVASKIRTTLLPSITKISKTTSGGARKVYLSLLERQLLSLTAGFEKELDGGLLKLSKTEIEVCRLIQAGNSSKDICEAMKLSFDTVQTHRRNIRKKLGLNGRKLNLHTYLLNRML